MSTSLKSLQLRKDMGAQLGRVGLSSLTLSSHSLTIASESLVPDGLVLGVTTRYCDSAEH